jgi:hypothetical protein
MPNDLYNAGVKLEEAFEEFRRELQRQDKRAYERWKAGGYIVSTDVVTAYPTAIGMYSDYKKEVCPDCGDELEDGVCKSCQEEESDDGNTD